MKVEKVKKVLKIFTNLKQTNFMLSFWLFLFLLTTYSILRAGFYFSNLEFYKETVFSEILVAFIYGIRFDIAAILMINLPILILFNLPVKFYKICFFSYLFFFLFCFINLIGIGFNIADYAYYPTIQRRLLFEPFTQTLDIFRMVPGLFKNYTLLILAFLVFSAFFIWLALKVYKLTIKKHQMNFSYWKSTINLILLVLLTIIGIRGGFQLKPIRHTNAFYSDSKPLGYLVLNSTYTVIRSYFQYTFPDYYFFTEKEAISIVTEMIKADDETMIDKDYPFMRMKTPVKPQIKKNIVLFIMESWSAEYVGSISGWETKTPFFDSLANKGILFTNFLANGQRSIEAVPSILASLPAVFPSSIIGSRAEVNKIRGLGSILKEIGYTTSFHHGASSGSMGFDAYVPSAGFDLYFTKESFSNFADSLYDGIWGIFDEPFFLDAANKMNKFGKPFCSVIFSLSSHDPFKIPTNRKQIFDIYKNETDFQKAMRYSDFSLRKFFAYAEKQDWYKNTIFFITGDHTFYTTRNDVFSSFHIPLLIFDPENQIGKVETQVGSHVDILPTILDLLNIKTIHSSMGRSLLDEKLEGFGAMTFFPNFLYFSNTCLFVDDFENKKEFFLNFREVDSKQNTYLINKEKSEKLERNLRAYVQATSKALNNDKVYKGKY